MAKKRGIQLKGAQGDAYQSTDVSQGAGRSTAHQDVAQGSNKRRKK